MLSKLGVIFFISILTVDLPLDKFRTYLTNISTESPHCRRLPRNITAEERLINDLLKENEDSTEKYNRLIRPSKSIHEKVNVSFDLLISQLIGVNEREQYMITKVWLPQLWLDIRLSWVPAQYENITKLQLPSEKIWLPDIVLYNNADGQYEESLKSNAVVIYNGTVSWMPPAIYRSACNIKVSDFPFDEQNCTMIFRSWTYNRKDISLQLMHDEATLDDFTPSGEWDIIKTPGIKNECSGEESYEDLTYSLIIKRKPLFYTVNLIIPCILITFLAILVFYTPSDSGEKMTLCISVLLALTVFLLLLSKMVPPTSLDVPLIGKYLMFTMVLVTLSIITSVCVLNLHHRKASTHTMPAWVRTLVLEILARILMMTRPGDDPNRLSRLGENKEELNCLMSWFKTIKGTTGKHGELNLIRKRYFVSPEDDTDEALTGGDQQKYGIHLSDVSGSRYLRRRTRSPVSEEILQALKSVQYITDHLKSRDIDQKVSEDWKFVAMVVDRLFFVIFIFVFFIGTLGIFIQPFI